MSPDTTAGLSGAIVRFYVAINDGPTVCARLAGPVETFAEAEAERERLSAWHPDCYVLRSTVLVSRQDAT